jgi:hypothetical protein
VSVRGDLQALSKELQLAGCAAVALGASLLLPWYQKSFFARGQVVEDNLSAFGVFTFVEAAVLLVALAVLFLVWARSQRKGFHLPGGDGTAITIAGGWAVLLLVWRLFDKPGVQGPGATIGIQWGIFGGLLAAGALIVAGSRVRAAHVPEPPNPAADDAGWVAPEPRRRERGPDRRPRDTGAVAEALRDRPAWEGEPREPSHRARTTRLPDDASDARTTRLPGDGSDARTTRLPDDASEARTTRLPGDPPEARTTRLPDEDPSRARTRKLPEPPAERLWRDDEPPR